MLIPAISQSDLERLTTLKEPPITPGSLEPEFDNITRLASFICSTPVAYISLVQEKTHFIRSSNDSHFYQAEPEDFSYHLRAEAGQLLEIRDIREKQEREINHFTAMAWDPVVFYAGVPLHDDRQEPLGALCVLDYEPRTLCKDQREALLALAKQVEVLLELRQKNQVLERIKVELDEQNSLLKEFAGVASHDMKMPLANMIITADILKAKYGDLIGEEGFHYLENLKQSGLKLNEYISGLLLHYESGRIAGLERQEFDLHHLLEDIIDLLNIREDVEIGLPEDNMMLVTNRTALEQIFLNLLSNSLKYNLREKIIIEISCHQDEAFYHFSIADNGIGIPENKQEEIFKIFTTLAIKDRKGNLGNGIGLSTVKRLIENLGGTIAVSSKPDLGTTFQFSIKRNF